MLVDKGKGISLSETKRLCAKKSIIPELQEQFPFAETHLDLSLLKSQPDVEIEIEDFFYDMSISVKDSEFFVTNNGLCLLIAYTQEFIQREARKLDEKKDDKTE